jgi:hypothetical protein
VGDGALLSMVWIWLHDKRTDDYKIILNYVGKLMKNKEAGKGPNFKKRVTQESMDKLKLTGPNLR